TKILRQRLLLQFLRVLRRGCRNQQKKNRNDGEMRKPHGPSTNPSWKNAEAGITSSFTVPGRRHSSFIRAAPPLSQNSTRIECRDGSSLTGTLAPVRRDARFPFSSTSFSSIQILAPEFAITSSSYSPCCGARITPDQRMAKLSFAKVGSGAASPQSKLI